MTRRQIETMANIAEILSAEIVEIPGCPGYGILLGGDASNHAYARELARCAQIHSSHPWVSAEQTDAGMLAAIKSNCAATKPGWLRNSTDDQIVALHAHSAIAHHIPYGCHLLAPETLAAIRLLAAKPELAAQQVLAYRGYEGVPGLHMVLDLLLSEGSVMVSTSRRLDLEAHDNDVTRFDSANVRGRSVASALLAGELAPGAAQGR